MEFPVRFQNEEDKSHVVAKNKEITNFESCKVSFHRFVVEAEGFVGTLQFLDSKQSAQVRQLLKTNKVKAEEEVKPWKRVSDVILQIVRCFVGSR